MLTALFAQPPQEPMGFLANPYLPFYMIGMMFLFWFVLLRPVTARQKKEQADMLASVKRGAKILTSGGIVRLLLGERKFFYEPANIRSSGLDIDPRFLKLGFKEGKPGGPR